MPRFSYPFSLRTQTLSYIVYSPRLSEGVCCCLGYFTSSVGISNQHTAGFCESTTECCKLISSLFVQNKWTIDGLYGHGIDKYRVELWQKLGSAFLCGSAGAACSTGQLQQ